MFCRPINPAMSRYFLRIGATMLLYVVFIVVSVTAFVHYHPTGILAYLLAVLPALPIVGQIGVYGLYLSEEKDEFVRNVQIQSMLWGLGATLAVTTIWGFLENFVHVRHMDLFLVYPLYCVLSGVCYGLVSARYK